MAPGGLSHVHAGGNIALLGPRRYEHISLKASIFTLQALLIGHPAFVILKDEPFPAVPCKAVLDPGDALSSPTYSVTGLGNVTCKRTCFTCSPAFLGADTRGISTTHTAQCRAPCWRPDIMTQMRQLEVRPLSGRAPQSSQMGQPTATTKDTACLLRE